MNENGNPHSQTMRTTFPGKLLHNAKTRRTTGVLERMRHPLFGVVALTTFIGSQVVLPIVAVQAQTSQLQKQKEAAEKPAPDWYVEARKRDERMLLAQGPRRGSNKVRPRAGRVQGSKPGNIKQSPEIYDPEGATSSLALKLNSVPTEQELMLAGQDCSSLVPLGIAEKNEYAEMLRRSDVKTSERALRLKRLDAMNLNFGKAMDRWNRKDFKAAVNLLKQYTKDFPESPWVPEAMMHIADEAMFTSRYEEAVNLYEKVLNGTSNNEPAQDGDPLLVKQGRRSFEIHRKALQKLAATQIMVGQFADAEAKVRDIMRNDPHWKRRTWASYWLQKLHLFQSNPRELHTCGGNALGIVLARLGKEEASVEAHNLRPPREAGFNLAEMAQITSKAGAPMRGFAAKPEQLAGLKTPFLIHVNNVKEQDKGEVFSCALPAKTGVATAVQAAPCCPTHLPKGDTTLTAKSNATGHGHFFVVLDVDAAKRQVEVINPRDGIRTAFTYDQLKKEWSGYGLALTQQKAPQRIAWLSDAQMKGIVGGCYVIGAQGDLGGGPENAPVNPNCDPSQSDSNDIKSPGSPSVSINRVTINMFVQDTPIWYHTPIGPNVKITLAYNSQDATSVNNAFGNKWMFNYGTYLSVLPSGAVRLMGPDGNQEMYTPNGEGTFFGEVGNYDKLVKTGTNAYELQMQEGEKLIYGIPSGISTQIPVLLEQRDRWGQSLTFSYTLSGTHVNLTKITDAQGKETNLDYDSNGHVVMVRDPFERVAKFEYDLNGNLVEVVDIEGHAFQYTYDDAVRITGLDTAQGPWLFEHDDFDLYEGTYYSHAVIVTDPLGEEEIYGYESHDKYLNTGSSKPYFHIDKNGHATITKVNTVIDGKGKITQTVAPNGDTTEIAYDMATAQPSKVTDTRGASTHYTYNATGRLSAITDTLGRTTAIHYNSNNLDVARWYDPAGVQQDVYTYNTYHQITRIRDRYDVETDFTYTTWGAVATVTNGLNQITIYNYDPTTKQLTSVGHKANSSASEVTVSSFTYDAVGRVRTVTDANNVTLTYDYNNLDAVTRVTYPDNTYASVEYVCCGMPGMVRDRAGRKSYYDYDPMKRVTRMQDAIGQSVEYRYDAAGNMVELLDANGKSTKWQYDDLDRVTKKIYADGTFTQYSFAQGLPYQVRTPRGAVITYNWDTVGNLTKIDYPNTADVTFAYDVLDRVTHMTDGVGTTQWLYSDVSTVSQEDGPWSSDDVDYSYDDLYRRKSMAVTNGGTTQYTYDALGRLDALSSSAGSWDYSYIGNTGLLSQITNPNTSKSIYSYDALERLTQVSNQKNTNANISTFAYGFDDTLDPQRDVRTHLEKTIGANPTQRVDYGYDGVDQLTGEVLSQGGTPLHSKSFAYDAMGNRTATGSVTPSDTVSATYTNNRLNQIVGLTSSWGGGANTLTSTLQYDQSGNLTRHRSTGTGSAISSHTEYVYDDVDRLTAVITKDSTTLANQNKTEFVYDGLSRLRVSKEFTWSGSAWVVVSNSEIRRVYDGMDVVQERNSSNNVTVTYTRDGNIGGILSRRSGSTSYYYHYDGSGNVVGMTDSSQNSVAEYAYDAYGNLLSSSGAQASNNNYRYSTKEHFGSIGLYNYGYRFYSPGFGRWINRDPIKEAGGLNLYAAFGNSPTSYVDAYGLVIDTPWDAANVGLGVASLVLNLRDGEYGWAAVDAAGLVVDIAATTVPFIPGGAATAIRVVRVGDKVVAVTQAAGNVSKARSVAKAVSDSDDDMFYCPLPSGSKEIRRKPGSLGQFKGTDALRRENKMAEDAAKAAGLDRNGRRTLHDMISGRNLSYKEILEEAMALKKGR